MTYKERFGTCHGWWAIDSAIARVASSVARRQWRCRDTARLRKKCHISLLASHGQNRYTNHLHKNTQELRERENLRSSRAVLVIFRSPLSFCASSASFWRRRPTSTRDPYVLLRNTMCCHGNLEMTVAMITVRPGRAAADSIATIDSRSTSPPQIKKEGHRRVREFRNEETSATCSRACLLSEITMWLKSLPNFCFLLPCLHYLIMFRVVRRSTLVPLLRSLSFSQRCFVDLKLTDRCVSVSTSSFFSFLSWSHNLRVNVCLGDLQQLKKVVDDGEVLRVHVDGGGCSGWQYKFDIERSINSDDK